MSKMSHILKISRCNQYIYICKTETRGGNLLEMVRATNCHQFIMPRFSCFTNTKSQGATYFHQFIMLRFSCLTVLYSYS